MKKQEKNSAYIDAENLYKGVRQIGWSLDYVKFRVWLKERHHVERAYLFIGYIEKYVSFYNYLKQIGYVLIFKEITHDPSGKVKGNCDAELVLCAVRDLYETDFDKFILVSGDGDFASLVRFLFFKKRLGCVIAPNNKKCSYLLKKIQVPMIFLNILARKLKKT